MLYVWLGIGLVCAGFCCQQVLLVARGQTWCQMQRGELVENRSPWRANLKDVFEGFLSVNGEETVPIADLKL